jgi:hypothetical protein
MRRWKLLVVLAGLAIVAAGVIVLRPEPPSRITLESCRRIREGMTRAEVEAILGPPGDYRTAVGETEYPTSRDSGRAWRRDPEFSDLNLNWEEQIDWMEHELFQQAVWVGDEFLVRCRLDDSGHLKERCAFARRTKQTAFDSFLWRLKRKWRRWFPE